MFGTIGGSPEELLGIRPNQLAANFCGDFSLESWSKCKFVDLYLDLGVPDRIRVRLERITVRGAVNLARGYILQ